jgi:hypothetical protein
LQILGDELVEITEHMKKLEEIGETEVKSEIKMLELILESLSRIENTLNKINRKIK